MMEAATLGYQSAFIQRKNSGAAGSVGAAMELNQVPVA